MKFWQIMLSSFALAACAQSGDKAGPSPGASTPATKGTISLAAKLPSDPGGIVVKSKYPAFGTFSGILAFDEKGCEAKGKCRIIDKGFRFTGTYLWAVRAKYKTDGASIPKFAQGIIGKAFDESYLPAAVIHDNYCSYKVRPFLATHRVFYDMLRALGISEQKAKIMYAGVLIGGPKWFALEPGQSCGQGCIRTLADGTDVTEDGPSRSAQNTPEQAAAFKQISAAITSGASRTLDDIDAQAQVLLPEDPFLALRNRRAVTMRVFENAPVIATTRAGG